MNRRSFLAALGAALAAPAVAWKAMRHCEPVAPYWRNKMPDVSGNTFSGTWRREMEINWEARAKLRHAWYNPKNDA